MLLTLEFDFYFSEALLVHKSQTDFQALFSRHLACALGFSSLCALVVPKPAFGVISVHIIFNTFNCTQRYGWPDFGGITPLCSTFSAVQESAVFERLQRGSS